MSHPLSVVVALDDHLLASSLVIALGRTFQSRGPFRTRAALDAELSIRAPRVAIVDATLGGVSVLSGLAHWITRHPATQFVLCTRPLEAPVAEAARLAGVVAVLDHRVHLDALVEGLRALGEGKAWPPTPVPEVIPARHRPGTALSGQEGRVLLLLQSGHGYAAIASILGSSIKTIERQVGALRRKFGIPRAQRVDWTHYDGSMG